MYHTTEERLKTIKVSLLVILFCHCSIVCVHKAHLEIASVLFTGSQNLINFEQKFHLNGIYAWSITYCYGPWPTYW